MAVGRANAPGHEPVVVAGVEGMVGRGFRHGAGATIADAMASGEALEENILKCKFMMNIDSEEEYLLSVACYGIGMPSASAVLAAWPPIWSSLWSV